MTPTELKIRACLETELAKLPLQPDGNFSSSDMAQMLRRICPEQYDVLKQCEQEAAEGEVICNVAPHWCRYSCLVYEDERISAYLLAWPEHNPGTEIHDHGSSCAAVAAVCGSIKETIYDQMGSHTRILEGGSTIEVPVEYVHKFEDADQEKGAFSLHLYSPPLKKMGFYQVDDRGIATRSGGWEE